MGNANLTTTNLLLGIMAAVSVFEALALVALAVLAYRVHSEVVQVLKDFEQRHLGPLVGQVNTVMATVDRILVDVHHITARVDAQSQRVNSAIQATIDRVDETADRVRVTVAERVSRVLDFVHTARIAVSSIFNGRHAA
jgi:hypothetical protein